MREHEAIMEIMCVVCYKKVTGDTIPPICGYNAGQHIYLDAGADRSVSA